MRRYVNFAAILVALIVAAPCFAQDRATVTPTWSGSYSNQVGNRYVGSTVCAVFGNQTVIQQELDITRHIGAKSSVTATIWNSTGITPSTWFGSYAYETDLDFNVGHRFGKYDTAVGGWMFFLYPAAKTNVPVFDSKVSRGFVRGHNTFSPFFETQWYGTTNPKDAGYHGGVYPRWGVAYSRPLAERVSLVAQFYTNYDASGGFGMTQGKFMFYGETVLQLAVNHSMIVMARAGIVGSFNDPMHGDYKGRPRIPVFNIGVSKSF